MPFPFMWIGALGAVAVLSVVLSIFGLVLRALDRRKSRVPGSVLAGLVSGFRDWAGASETGRRIGSPTESEPPELDDTTPTQAPLVERVHSQPR
jgi:hypothetical protein